MREIEAAGGLPFTDIVNNANLAHETTAETVLEALPYMERLSALSGLPLWLTSAEETVAAALAGRVPDLQAMKLRPSRYCEQRQSPAGRPPPAGRAGPRWCWRTGGR